MSGYKAIPISDILKNNAYPGRGIVIGKSQNGGFAAFAYFIMGRSENSRNRVFFESGDTLKTLPFDEKKVEDPSLIIYNAVRTFGKNIIVTNGDQTDTICSFLEERKTFEDALNEREFEPDKPNFTPRISGILNFDGSFRYKINILKAADSEGSGCLRFTYDYFPLNGVGHFIHTYKSDGNPLPSFEGEPERVIIPDDIREFTDEIWESLNYQNKISLYTKYINLKNGKCESKLLNKNKRGVEHEGI